MKPFWVSFYAPSPLMKSFEYHGPWWISGNTVPQSGDEDDVDQTLCAWVMATDADAAVETLRLAYDKPDRPRSLRVRFSEEKPSPDRSNPSGRFAFKDWMQWPWPVKPLEPRP